MELITHNLVGIIIQILCFNYLLFPMNVLFTIIFAYISHLVVDAFSKITYHTPEAHKDDKFWVIWHAIIYGVSILSLIIFIIPYWLGILFANIIDVWDWFILRPIQKKKSKTKGIPYEHHKLYAHRHADWIRENFLGWLPDMTHAYLGIIVEIVVIIICSIIVLLII